MFHWSGSTCFDYIHVPVLPFVGALYLLSTFTLKAVPVCYRRGSKPANNGRQLSLLCYIILARMEGWLLRENNWVHTYTVESKVQLL